MGVDRPISKGRVGQSWREKVGIAKETRKKKIIGLVWMGCLEKRLFWSRSARSHLGWSIFSRQFKEGWRTALERLRKELPRSCREVPDTQGQGDAGALGSFWRGVTAVGEQRFLRGPDLQGLLCEHVKDKRGMAGMCGVEDGHCYGLNCFHQRSPVKSPQTSECDLIRK